MSVPNRNDPCPCGSGKKFKKCCLGLDPVAPISTTQTADHLMKSAFNHHREGRLTQAEAACREVLNNEPDNPEALHLLGMLASQAGRYQAAIDLIGRAIRINGSDAGYYNDMGLAYGSINRLDQAIACYQKALALQPEFSIAQINLGCAYFNQGSLDDAVASYRKALELRPDLAAAHYNLGIAYYFQGRLGDAVASYRKSLALKPDYLEVYVNLANAYIDQSKPDAAEASCRQALTINPNLAIIHFNLGLACFNQGKLDDAVASYQKALALKPDYLNAHVNLGLAYHLLGRQADATACYQKALEIKPDSALVNSTMLFTMLYVATNSPEELFAEYRQFSQRCELPLKASWRVHMNSREPYRRLKVGYVSSDFRRHSVAYFIEPILANHDKSEVDVHCYYNHTKRDDVTERIAACADHWIPCKGMSNEQLAERIRADGIDILVDLAGHTIDNRLLAFARKPAPIQVTYLGYPATTGLSAMDYRFSTLDVDPSGQETWHSEALYRLPKSLWCYRPPADRPEAAAFPPAMNRGYITFGSMNNFAKISPETYAVWRELLRAIPEARLVMTSVPEGSVRQSLHARFTAQGIEPHRLVLHGRVPNEQYFEILGQIDIALDPFPYNGTTTTCETLWMGIPVITLIGQSSVSRSGYALLKSVGLEELAARDKTDYVNIAVRLANNLDYLTGLRMGMRQRVMSSPLRDEAGFTRDLEAGYRTMWYTWCTLNAGSHP